MAGRRVTWGFGLGGGVDCVILGGLEDGMSPLV